MAGSGRGGKRRGAGRPPVFETGPSVVFGVRLPAELVQAIKDAAQRLGTTPAKLVAQAVREFLTRLPSE